MIQNVYLITNSPSEGSVLIEAAAMREVKQKKTAKPYPGILRARITVYPIKQPNKA